MPGDFRTNLRRHLSELHPKHATSRLQATTRSQIHRAIQNAQKELERFGYHIAVVTDTGSMISAKVYGRSPDRDFSKSREALTHEAGYPINLQLSLSDDKGITIYSYRGAGQGVSLISSKKPSEIEDAIIKELESQIIAGINAVKQMR
jgi:hypothetical protein